MEQHPEVRRRVPKKYTGFAVVSRAPLNEIEPFKKRMGWKFTWVSSFGTEFNFDFNVSFPPEQIKSGKAVYNFAPLDMDIDEREGVSAFYRDKNGGIYRTYGNALIRDANFFIAPSSTASPIRQKFGLLNSNTNFDDRPFAQLQRLSASIGRFSRIHRARRGHVSPKNTVSVDEGAATDHTRRVTADEDGRYSFAVPL
ncbi:MAG TPA: DUF899 family protein [Casimicrobiaceae bacterium]